MTFVMSIIRLIVIIVNVIVICVLGYDLLTSKNSHSHNPKDIFVILFFIINLISLLGNDLKLIKTKILRVQLDEEIKILEAKEKIKNIKQGD